MSTKKDYINLIKWSCLVDAFNSHYFIRVIVIYLLSQNVMPWVAVSIPIVIEFARLVARGINLFVKFALKVDYKKYHIFHLIAFLLLGLIISQCRSLYTIYLFSFISGIISGIKYATITKLDTQNKEYEPFCFIEEERANVVGGTLGLIISQVLYDLNPLIYVIGFVVLIIVGFALSFFIKNVPTEDEMAPLEDTITLDKKSKKDTIISSSLFGLIAGFWCMGWSGFEELAPLISNKIGYLNSIYTVVEIIVLTFISGKLLKFIAKKKKLLLTESIIACIDVFCLFISALTLTWWGLLIAYIITGFTSTMGDPLWGSIMSAYSTNSREKWVIVNKVYFIIRAIFTIITWIICRECIIRGVENFRWLSIVLICLIITTYLIANKVNKKIFGSSV